MKPTLQGASNLTDIDSAPLAREAVGLIDPDSGDVKRGMGAFGDQKAVVLSGQSLEISIRHVDSSALGDLEI